MVQRTFPANPIQPTRVSLAWVCSIKKYNKLSSAAHEEKHTQFAVTVERDAIRGKTNLNNPLGIASPPNWIALAHEILQRVRDKNENLIKFV